MATMRAVQRGRQPGSTALPAPKRDIAEVGRSRGIAGASPAAIGLDHRLGKPRRQTVFAGEEGRLVWLVFRIVHGSIKAHVGSLSACEKIGALANAERRFWLPRLALFAALSDFSPTSSRTVARSAERRPSVVVCRDRIRRTKLPTGATGMDDDHNSVLEARWLLAVPASMLLTVLIAGLLLG
jgi:hypothetical protein